MPNLARIQAPADADPPNPPTRPCGLPDLLPALHPRLLRFARSQLGNPTLAEDAVSETLLSALQAGRRFDTPGQATAWVFGVLRHKLVDQLREQHRQTPAGDLVAECDAAGGGWTGGWQHTRQDATDPQTACEQREFEALLARCCQNLPASQSRAFVMREVLEMDTPSICRGMGVSEGHLWVLVHRARVQLRRELRGYRAATGRSNEKLQP